MTRVGADLAATDPKQRSTAKGSARSRRRARRGRASSSGRRLFAFDRQLGVPLVAGADEAGRGCLAGPLMAAGVLFDYDALTTRELRALSALNDSKQHSHEAREELFPLVLRTAARVVVVSRSVRAIDERGLHKTNLAALRDALLAVTRDVRGEVICLSDGFPVRDLGRPQRAIVNGDATSAAIAAASIVAKVTRDRYMRHADGEHPGWSFAEHVGYSTPVHREAILRQGVSPLHRMSFQSLAYQQLAL
ncbi:MAG TPA: ribonuclease HII [Solirubrobacteraceae bacterium]|nr:ribonuclease HII [Solirubrobacteraceae bacterium]